MHRIVLACLALGLSAAAFAQRGATLYAAACAGCHGADLTSGTAPPLTGAAFLRRWSASTPAAPLAAVRQMPPPRRWLPPRRNLL